MLVWHRVRAALRKTRRLARRIEHPCHICHAILLSVLRKDGWGPAPV
jgi:hypothetical protein